MCSIHFYFKMLIKLHLSVCSLSVEMLAGDVHGPIFEQLSYFIVNASDDFANLGDDEG
jgi:hypothetical protein